MPASTAIAQPGPNPATRKPAIAAPPIIAVFIASCSSAFACWSSGDGHGLRDDPGGGGEEERGRGAVHRCERGEVPDLSVAGDEQGGGHRLREAADDVRPDHHPVPRQPVGPDPADEQEHDQRDLARGEDQAEVGLRARQVEDGERERDRRDRAADEGDRPAGEEEAELALAERRASSPARVSQ